MWLFVLIILLVEPTLIWSAFNFNKHGSDKPKRLHTAIQSWISSPASFSPWKTQIAKKQQASMLHFIFTLTIAMSSVILLRASAEKIFSISKNRQFVPRCSNRNNPGELHSSVETCITRRPHWGSPSWRRLHLGSILKTPSLGKSILKRLFWILFLTPSRGKSIQIAHSWRSCQQVW